jgi:hypothetical protein
VGGLCESPARALDWSEVTGVMRQSFVCSMTEALPSLKTMRMRSSFSSL